MNDLILNGVLKRGSKGRKVELLQAWLCLNGHKIQVDGDFGPATERAVLEFQQSEGITDDGRVDQGVYDLLTRPMHAALASIEPDGRSLPEMVVSYAEQHLARHPMEVGGQNRGPWVRLYMDGNEGDEWAWCAGFVSFIIEQARASLDAELPLKKAVSCRVLAADARERGTLRSGAKAAERADVTPGSLFLVKKAGGGYAHVGIVTGLDDEVFYTIEGNTNDEGSAEGFEVCARIRGYKNKDFILLG